MASILIVDDETEMCGLLKEVLESAGHQAVATNDPLGVARLMEEAVFDLAIVDIVMPNRDGIDVVKELRQRFPLIGLIAMSGAKLTQRELYLEAGTVSGADVTFGKPFSKKVVLACIAEALEKSALRKTAANATERS